MTSKLFITGGSGYIGSAILPLATTQNYTVRTLSRNPTSDTKLLALGATPVRGDLTSLSVLTTEARNADIVIHLADAIAGNFAMTPEERSRINQGAINALGKGLEGSNKAFISTSGSLKAAADPSGGETNEDAPAWPDAPFDDGREPCALAFQEKGVKVSIVRLAPWVYGRGGSGVKLFMEGAIKAKELVYIGAGEERTTTVDVDDAARLYLLIAKNENARGVYNCTDKTNVTFKQLTEAMGRAVDVPVRSKSYADAEAEMGPFFAKFLSLGNRASNAKAKAELGWEPNAKKGILEDIESGSYVALAEGLRKAKA